MNHKLIRFIDSRYRDLFAIKDGERIRMEYPNGEVKSVKCQYLDDTHTQIGNNCYHICEFAERMEKNGITIKPEKPITDLSYYPKKYLMRNNVNAKGKPVAYHLIDQTEDKGFTYCREPEARSRFCIYPLNPDDLHQGPRYKIVANDLDELLASHAGDNFDHEKIRSIVAANESLYERLRSEYNKYYTGLKCSHPEHIIESAYEISIKEDVLDLFKTGVFEEEVEAALKDANITLDKIYTTWTQRDLAYTQDLHDMIEEIAAGKSQVREKSQEGPER